MTKGIIYSCSKCDAQYPKWSGRCFECGGWGTLEENTSPKGRSASGGKFETRNSKKEIVKSGQVMTFADLAKTKIETLKSNLSPVKEVAPKGWPLGSLTLLAGEPGAGKSTLAMQLILNLAQSNKVLYFSSEESTSQIKDKIERLGGLASNFLFSDENDVNTIGATINNNQAKVAVIDSIQTIATTEAGGEAGSLQQLRACTAKLLEIAKQQGVALIIIGHVTKEGVVAGPKTLEHLVDIVFYLEGDRDSRFRILRSTKNRFGSAGQVSVMQMTNQGLKIVKKAATAFIMNYQPKPGSVITAVVDSGQVFFLEIQSLVTKSNFGYAKRTASGFQVKRMEVLLAVMKKRLNLNFDAYDVYVNLVGGWNLKDPALDLPVCLSLISSMKNKVLADQTVVFGEIGLTGELRAVKDTALRLETVAKHKFNKVILPPLGGGKQKTSSDKFVSLDALDKVVSYLGW